jgi:hypothetical protein
VKPGGPETQAVISARASKKKDKAAARKAATAQAAVDRELQLEEGAKQLAYLEDRREQADAVDDAEMRDPSTRYQSFASGAISSAAGTDTSAQNDGAGRADGASAKVVVEVEGGLADVSSPLSGIESTPGGDTEVMHEVPATLNVSAHFVTNPLGAHALSPPQSSQVNLERAAHGNHAQYEPSGNPQTANKEKSIKVSHPSARLIVWLTS